MNLYIKEVHPEDGWYLEINNRQGVNYKQPNTSDERAGIAKACRRAHDIEMPMALDGMDNRIDKLYSAAPERLYIIDPQGVITYRSARGLLRLSTIEDWYTAQTTLR